MGVYGTNMPFATIMAFPTATVLAEKLGWRFPFYLGTIIAFVAALVFISVIREGPLKNEHARVEVAEVKKAIKSVEIWKTSLVWMLFNITALAFLSWAPTLFQDFKGLEPFHASLLASVQMYAALGFVPVFGWASDKVGRRKPFIVSGSVLLALTLIVSAYTFDLTLLLSVIVLGVAAAMIPPAVMTIPPQTLPPNLVGTGFSIVTLCQNVGVTLSAPLAGYLIQTTHSLSLTFIGVSLFAFASALTALTLKTK
jgi:predicted MFS family arabinose efflux permease